ncbi:MAG: hypothetical protein NC085_13890 [Muribaculaceae bacterium]|nr:hypothetical protein [Muribaculaceae bacterium]
MRKEKESARGKTIERGRGRASVPYIPLSPLPLSMVVPFVRCERLIVYERGLKIQK